jgi:hypothetical protein
MSLGSIPARGSFCDRRLLLVRDPLGLLGEPEPFAPEVVIARPKIWTARFMSALQRQVGLFAIPLRSRQHANRTCQNQSGSREFSLPGTSRPVAALFRWTLGFPHSPQQVRGQGTPPSGPPPWRGSARFGPLKQLVTGMDANSGEPWSEMDLEDLRHSLDYGNTFAATARFLCRDEDEVRHKARALGLTEHPGKRIRVVR